MELIHTSKASKDTQRISLMKNRYKQESSTFKIEGNIKTSSLML